MKIYKSILILMLAWIVTSCSQEFLERDPVGLSNSDVYYSTIEGINKGVTGTYAAINTCPAGLHNLDVMYIAFGSIASDEAEAGGEQGAKDIIDFQNWDQGRPQTTEPKAISEMYYGYNYKTILRANSTIKGINTFRENNPDMDSATKAKLDQFEGEMEFIMAFTHFKLMQVYGGIPIVYTELGSS